MLRVLKPSRFCCTQIAPYAAKHLPLHHILLEKALSVGFEFIDEIVLAFLAVQGGFILACWFHHLNDCNDIVDIAGSTTLGGLAQTFQLSHVNGYSARLPFLVLSVENSHLSNFSNLKISSKQIRQL